MSLSTNNIFKRFGSVQVLSNVSLEFLPGTVTAIVGDNGAGKSTLLKILAGVHEPDIGEVMLAGAKLSGFSPQLHRLAGIEMVYQDLALAKGHDITTNLFIGREKYGPFGWLDRQSMYAEGQAVLKTLEIGIDDLSLKVGTLSGGQQQAVAIARAILFNPKVLLLDEPTASLAAREVGMVIELIKKQRELGRIIILVSHRLNDVFAVSDRVVVLKRGQVFTDDSIEKLTMPEVVNRIVS